MKWIKTTEKLPSESDGYVLVCMPNEFPYNQSERITLAQYSEYANQWFKYGGKVGGKAPIAWMPLPEPVDDNLEKELDDQPTMEPFELRVVRPKAGDCILSCDIVYDVVFHSECTVREFIDEVLKKVESGYIRIGNIFDGPQIEYDHDKIVSGAFSPDILDARIKNATAHGGWINMDYMLDI